MTSSISSTTTRVLRLVPIAPLLVVGCALGPDDLGSEDLGSEDIVAGAPDASSADEAAEEARDALAPGLSDRDPEDADDVVPVDGEVALATPIPCGAGTDVGDTSFRVVHFNVLGSTFGANWGTRRAVVAKRMKHVLSNSAESKAAIYGLTEVTSSEATYLAQQLGSSYSVAVHNRLQAIVYDKSNWTIRDSGKYTFTSGSSGYHGFVHVRLENNASGKQINVVEAHMSPNAVADAANKRTRQLSQIKSTVGDWKNPVLVLGDMNWNAPDFEDAAGSGYCSIRTWARSYYPKGARAYRTLGGTDADYGTGGRIIDYGLARNGVTHGIALGGYWVLRGNFDDQAGSDHHMLAFQLTL